MVKTFQSKKIKISELSPGMKIKSYKSGEVVFSEVTAVWNTIVKPVDQVKLIFTNGTSVNCSKNHPIMVLADDDTVVEKYPLDLTEYDQIISDNNLVYLYEVELNQDNDENYIDITVADTNVFFTASNTTDEMILTHNSQGSIRNGAATGFFPFFHYEFEDLVVLKNNKGTEDNRARHIDYCVQFNKLAYERLLTGGNISLFSPSDVPGLYDAFFQDQDLFKRLYEGAEANPKIRRKTMKAVDLFTTFMSERKNTGRIYFMNVDHCNTHSSFIESVAPVRQSNLCLEVCLPAMPLQSIESEDPAVPLCTLSAINWGKIKEPKDFEKVSRLAVRGLDALLDYQSYPLKAAKAHTVKFRPLGIGLINLAYWIAKMGFKYSDDSALAAIDEYTEAWTYYTIKASMELAKEKGACGGNDMLKYSQGIVPMDTRKAEVDELVPYQERMPWDQLREDLRTYGIRNATLFCLMPSESSSQISNATNGIEPPRSLISIKQSKDGVLKQVVPEYRRLKNRYELLWDQKTPEGYLKICAVLQKYIDQSISANTSYNPAHYPDNQLPMSELLRHMLMMYKWGLKTAYYFTQNDGQGEVDTDKMIQDMNNDKMAESGDDEANCDSCMI